MTDRRPAPRRRRRTDQRGAATAELALTLPLLIAVTIGLVWLLVSRTALGRACYAVGGNPNAAVYTGIDVGSTRFAAFVLSRSNPDVNIGIFFAAAGVLYTMIILFVLAART